MLCEPANLTGELLMNLLAWASRILRPVSALALIFLFSHRGNASGVVTNCTESDLRAALAGGGLVTLACDGTIGLSNTLVLSANTIIDGSGRDVVLHGMSTNRVLVVSAGISCALTNLKVFNGWHASAGGGISNAGVLHLQRCVVSNNVAGLFLGISGQGGGIYNAGTLSLVESTVAANRAVTLNNSRGAGIFNAASATMWATACTFHHNNGATVGGAILLRGHWTADESDQLHIRFKPTRQRHSGNRNLHRQLLSKSGPNRTCQLHPGHRGNPECAWRGRHQGDEHYRPVLFRVHRWWRQHPCWDRSTAGPADKQRRTDTHPGAVARKPRHRSGQPRHEPCHGPTGCRPPPGFRARHRGFRDQRDSHPVGDPLCRGNCFGRRR